MHGNIPKASSEITPEWLTGALRAGGKVGDVTVEHVALEALAAGVGYMGEVVRLRLTTSGGNAPATMIAKVPTQDPTLRVMMKPTRVYEREARFFDEIAEGLPISVPTCYRAAYDLDADDYLILMEDLGNVPTGDQVSGVSVEAAGTAAAWPAVSVVAAGLFQKATNPPMPAAATRTATTTGRIQTAPERCGAVTMKVRDALSAG